MARLEKNLYT